MPWHIMFTTDTKGAHNYIVRAVWIMAMTQKKTFHATVTTNEKGGTDGHILGQLLLHYVKTLYPDMPWIYIP
jgi:hypothetical protein